MTDHDLYESYGRIDERLKSIELVLYQLNANRRCDTNTEKIKTLERIVWGALTASITALYKSFWPGGH